MIETLAVMIPLGMAADHLFKRFNLPGLLGMILLGMALGPWGLDVLFFAYGDASRRLLAADLRMLALIVILLRAGLGIHRSALRKVGASALRMSVIPCLFEGTAVTLLGLHVLHLPLASAGMLGFVLAAVSPAVIVPQMLELIGTGRGKKREVPTLILSSASVDDVIAITLFGAFLGLGERPFALELVRIPLSIGAGAALGALLAAFLLFLYQRFELRNTEKTLVLLGAAFCLRQIELSLDGLFPVASLLGIMVLGYTLLDRAPDMSIELSSKLAKLWIFAQILLFVLIGGAVNLGVVWQSGLLGLLVILAGLSARTIGVFLSLIGSDLDGAERLFCAVAFLPKATVQAAIGAIPLAAGAEGGELILAMAVLSILVSAPAGSLLIHRLAPRLLSAPQH